MGYSPKASATKPIAIGDNLMEVLTECLEMGFSSDKEAIDYCFFEVTVDQKDAIKAALQASSLATFGQALLDALADPALAQQVCDLLPETKVTLTES